jgi:hypothetical protein
MDAGHPEEIVTRIGSFRRKGFALPPTAHAVTYASAAGARRRTRTSPRMRPGF